MALRRGSVEMGLGRSEMKRHTYDADEMSLIPRHLEKWFQNEDLHGLCIGISDPALAAASDGTSGEVEWSSCAEQVTWLTPDWLRWLR